LKDGKIPQLCQHCDNYCEIFESSVKNKMEQARHFIHHSGTAKHLNILWDQYKAAFPDLIIQNESN